MLGLTESAAIIRGLSGVCGLWGSIQPSLAFADDLFAVGLVLGLLFPCLIWGVWRLAQSAESAGQARFSGAHRCPECRLRLVAAVE